MIVTRALFAILALSPVANWAQQLDWRLVPGNWSGGLGLGYERTQQSTQTTSSSTSTTTQRLRESVRIANNGFYVLDPRLISGGAGIQLDLAQQSFSGTTLASTAKDRVTGYDFNLTALKNKPYVGNIFANRTHVISNQAFGGAVDGTREVQGIRLELHEDSILKEKGFPWFKADLSIQQDQSNTTTTLFDRVTQQNERNKQVNFFAQKGFTTADLTARYFSLNDTETAGLVHSVDFGEGLNHTLNSNLNLTQTHTVEPSSSLDWSEELSLLHSRNLASSYAFSFNQQKTNAIEQREQNARATLTHELYTNLSSNVIAEGDRLVLQDGTVTSNNLSFSQVYRHSLSQKGSFSVNWSGGYGQTRNDLQSGLIRISAERHQALAPFGGGNGFFLNRVNAVATSVTVFNVTSGFAVPDSEYDVVVIGDRVRIEPVFRLPAAPRNPIEPDDILDIGYDYQLDPQLKYETRTLGFGGSINYGWISAFYQHFQSDINLLEGQGFLTNSSRSDSISATLNQHLGEWPTTLTLAHSRRTETPLNDDPALFNDIRTNSILYRINGMVIQEVQTDASLSYSRTDKLEDQDQILDTLTEFEANGFWHEFSGQVRASFNDYQSNRLAFKRRLLISTVNWQVDYRMAVVGSVNFSDVKYSSSNQRDSIRSARSTARWSTDDGWLNDVFAELRLHDTDRIPTETIIQIGGRTSLSIGKLSLTGGASYDRLVRGATKSQGLRFDVSALRSF